MVDRPSRVVVTPEGEHPYKVVLEKGEEGSSEHPVATIREGEALIRASSTLPSARRVEKLRETP
jgi:hypothetical protein